MKILLIGATGFAGRKILSEALSRNHQVTAVARKIENLPPHENMSAKSLDITEEPGLKQCLSGNDAVISSLHFLGQDFNKLSAAIKASGVRRWIIVGGAGSLLDQNSVEILDTPGFPEAYKPEASAGREFLKQLKKEQSLEWTFISPSAEFIPGDSTGKFRIGNDHLLVSASGRSFITNSDYAIAVIDELEKPQHVQKRFTVGY